MALVSRNPREASTVFSQHAVCLALVRVDLTACPVLEYTPLSLSGGCSRTFSGEEHVENTHSPDESVNSLLPAFPGGLCRAVGEGEVFNGGKNAM